MTSVNENGPLGETTAASTDEDFMRLVLELAAQAKGLASPNPLVGALLVKDGQIVGRGVHRYADVTHAEVLAIAEAGAEARGATLYTNLEPCRHYGRTPPCTDAIIGAGIARVVSPMIDPNPQVAGRGFAVLRQAGIQVETGLCQREARRLNEKFIKYITTGRPFVHLKIAMTLDGRIATRTGQSRWITGEEARRASQALRHEYDAILVGSGTVLMDDPLLTMRLDQPRSRPLIRVVLDSSLKMPLASKLVQSARAVPLLIFCGRQPDEDKWTQLERAGAIVIEAPASVGRVDLEKVLQELGRRELSSLIVEGGSTINAAFIEARLVDKLTFFIAPKILGSDQAIPAIGGKGSATLDGALRLKDIMITPRGEDIELTGYPDY
jgi:diaminohydroxyphosphoribosylaminopyrimidine deaminase/5-amino-6-(5-phosphoribosylamino)uracil reductase